jgi:2-C-methyl-D-erythritol 4-phosphate cytidylyltransferase
MIVALIPAAGTGARVGGAAPKQYHEVTGRPMLCFAIEAFASATAIEHVYVVLAPQDSRFGAVPLSERARERVTTLPVGGATRHESVLNALDALGDAVSEDDWVLVHDAARPGITVALIERLIEALHSDPVGGLLALPVADTLKRADPGVPGTPRVAATSDRSGLWQAQTPQMFRFGLLRRALRAARDANAAPTDEAGAVEALGLAPLLVAGSLRNFKVTYPEDLALAALVLQEGHA